MGPILGFSGLAGLASVPALAQESVPASLPVSVPPPVATAALGLVLAAVGLNRLRAAARAGWAFAGSPKAKGPNKFTHGLETGRPRTDHHHQHLAPDLAVSPPRRPSAGVEDTASGLE